VLSDGLALGHLIGEVGASSTLGVLSSDISWKSLDESDAFIPAKPKSTTRGENANGKMEGYVFGRGGKRLIPWFFSSPISYYKFITVTYEIQKRVWGSTIWIRRMATMFS
jgi:hypothetical protein